jgi:GNAT superfamily N-acetyltransferase
MPADEIRVVRQAELLPDQVERFCAINTEAFPPSERKSCSSLCEEIADGKRWLFAAIDDGSLVGYALILPNVVPDIHLLEFLAVDRAWRGKGVGTRLLEVISRELRAAAGGILIEVESDEAGSPEEWPMRRWRIEFYIRNGFQFINGPFGYSAPNQMGGENVSMKLMWLGFKDAVAPSGDKLLECIAGIYAKSYDLTEDSPLFQAARIAFESQTAPDS